MGWRKISGMHNQNDFEKIVDGVRRSSLERKLDSSSVFANSSRLLVALSLYFGAKMLEMTISDHVARKSGKFDPIGKYWIYGKSCCLRIFNFYTRQSPAQRTHVCIQMVNYHLSGPQRLASYRNQFLSFFSSHKLLYAVCSASHFECALSYCRLLEYAQWQMKTDESCGCQFVYLNNIISS